MSTAMWRFQDAALERAALIYTFSRSTIEDTPSGNALYMRQLVMLIDLVHEFCFNARRAIERAEKYQPGMIANIQKWNVHREKTELFLSNYDHPKQIPLTQESLWWILGRIIHSKETQVIFRTADIVMTNQVTGRHYSVRQPVAFAFSSDRDSDKTNHFVELESLILAYVGVVSPQIDRVINARNYPAPPGA
jgi:hypothetical protein